MTVIRGSICDKFKFVVIKQIETFINDEQNVKELEEEKPLGTTR